MFRYLRFSSWEELRVKLAHLGFPERVSRELAESGPGEVYVAWRKSFSHGGEELRGKRVIIFSSPGGCVAGVSPSLSESPCLLEEEDLPEELRESLRETLEARRRRISRLRARGRVLDLTEGPLLMGIVNVTPDSFSDGGRFFSRDAALERALSLVEEGAHIIDVGGESTRPGADPVPEEEELRRVVPVVEELAKRTEAVISVDTYKSAVAREALRAGAHVVNDISGLTFSPDMAETASRYGAAVVIMHIRGTPRDMQKNPRYDSLPDEIISFFRERVSRALREGIPEDSIVLDPGIGFGKRYEDNLYIVKNLEEFRLGEYPLLVGPSRKSFIGIATGKEVGERIFGTAASVALLVASGADILRVHDVKEMKDALSLAAAVREVGAC